MARSTFAGGIHPHYNKELTNSKQIETGNIPSVAVIPLAQHIGSPCEPAVEVGDEVKKGQVIGNPRGFVSSPIHASISGKVTAIEKRPHPSGRDDVTSVIIESDGNDEWIDGLVEHLDHLALSAEELKQIVLNAGIVGKGGATFPTHVKLSPPPNKKITTVILNGAECEPYLSADHRVMLETPHDVVEGLKIIMKILDVKEGYIGIENNKQDAIRAISDSMQDLISPEYDIKLITLDTKYPQGAEKQLIKVITGNEVPSGGLPMDVGVVVQNVGTAAAVYEAVRYGRPFVERVLTVSGLGVNEQKNIKARIGTPFSEIIEQCGGLTDGVVKVISGGPMMGMAQHSLDVPVIKGTSGILAFTKKEAVPMNVGPCLRCGRCIAACPMKLEPYLLGTYGELYMFEEASAANAMDCMECGSCVFICPAKRPLVHLMRFVKREVIVARHKEKEKAEKEKAKE
ncbi:electron transport complex subunit RsxC [Thermodesulfobacteriota bacterium]